MFSPLRSLPTIAPTETPYTCDDVLVLFGELFPNGYANGLVKEAQKRGMKIIYSTVGRRNKDDQQLRPLNDEELSQQPTKQPTSFINIPLEAGCDMEPCESGVSPVDQMSQVKMSGWQDLKLDWKKIDESQKRADERFQKQTKLFIEELEKILSDTNKKSRIIFAHLMAGGVPRAKISMPVMNRVFKGQGDRHIPSKNFYNSDLGKFCLMNFKEVTANTLKHLLNFSSPLKEQVESKGGRVSYIAYGYHGTDVLVKKNFQWQTYTPYFQGWAKKELENIASDFFHNKKTQVCVFNCPEILTSSSSVFNGVELSLYPLLGALAPYKGQPFIDDIFNHCFNLLNDGVTLEQILQCTDDYITSDLTTTYSKFEQWPQDSGKEQMEQMLETSAKLRSLHKNQKELITFKLSEVIFETCGRIMINKSYDLEKPVWWLGHDILAKCASQSLEINS